MTLALNDNWKERAGREGYEERFLITITIGATTWTALSGACSQFSYAVAVHSVEPMAAEMDVVSRRLEVDGNTVVVADDWIRDVIVGNRIRGAKMRIRHGFADLAEADFVDYWTGAIEGTFPEPSDEAGHGVVRLECLSMLEILRQTNIMGRWIQKHPLDVIYDILSVHMALDASLIDGDGTGGSAFDPDAAAYADISHIVVSRSAFSNNTTDTTVKEPTPALTLVDELAMLLNGTLYVNEEGELSFSIFDSTAASQATWGEDEIDELKQVSLDDDLFNRVEFQFMPELDSTMTNLQLLGTGGSPQGFWRGSHVVNDTDSQTAHAYPGTSSRVVTHKASSPWIGDGTVFCTLGDTSLDRDIGVFDNSTSFILVGALVSTFAGTRESQSGSGSQPANAKISAARPLYLLTEYGEIIKATSLTVRDSSVAVYVTVKNESGSTTNHGPYHSRWDVSGVTRASFGTSAHYFFYVVDITTQQHISEQWLKRHGNGIAKVEVHTGLAEFDKEVGDLVSLEWPAYVGYGLDGLEAADGKWEIVLKEHVSGEGKIRWVLAWAAVASPTMGHASALDRFGASASAGLKFSAEDDDVVRKHKVSGMDVSHTTLLTGSMAAGTACSGNMRSENPAATTLTFKASSDNYVFWDIETSSPTITAVTVGAAAPGASPMEILVAMVVTNATDAISITTDDVPTTALDGSKLVALSVDSAQMATSAVIARTIATDAVIASKLASGAVTTPKIADAAIGPVHVVHNEKKAGMFVNAQFSIAKKG